MAVEIVCDESGSEGEKLVGGVTAVFAHASVRIGAADAAACLAELRDRIRSPAREYKANHLLRPKHRPALLWLLGPDGPVLGNAYVQLVDKRALLLDRLGHTPAGPLEPHNDALRARGPHGSLDPLFPAIVRAVRHWGDDVVVRHDFHPTLTPHRIAHLRRAAPGLRELTLLDSRADHRVQVADFVAGIARRVAEEESLGRPDPEVARLLRPYLVGIGPARPGLPGVAPGR
ncbi:NAD-dependent protein deacetylase of SIR2 family [Actinosynnema sp. NPDC050436]|uniref:NAD-dependent protein deacetylase of SIR2 family n=1 Tax=Actinosynnema sp. NPDC050436 TaxID=3155659 RepID=UPI0034089D67